MADFFFGHLKHDITMLSKVVGKNEDETCLLIHLVLKEIVREDSLNGNKHYNTLQYPNLITLQQFM